MGEKKTDWLKVVETVGVASAAADLKSIKDTLEKQRKENENREWIERQDRSIRESQAAKDRMREEEHREQLAQEARELTEIELRREAVAEKERKKKEEECERQITMERIQKIHDLNLGIDVNYFRTIESYSIQFQKTIVEAAAIFRKSAIEAELGCLLKPEFCPPDQTLESLKNKYPSEFFTDTEKYIEIAMLASALKTTRDKNSFNFKSFSEAFAYSKKKSEAAQIREAEEAKAKATQAVEEELLNKCADQAEKEILLRFEAFSNKELPVIDKYWKDLKDQQGQGLKSESFIDFIKKEKNFNTIKKPWVLFFCVLVTGVIFKILDMKNSAGMFTGALLYIGIRYANWWGESPNLVPALLEHLPANDRAGFLELLENARSRVTAEDRQEGILFHFDCEKSEEWEAIGETIGETISLKKLFDKVDDYGFELLLSRSHFGGDLGASWLIWDHLLDSQTASRCIRVLRDDPENSRLHKEAWEGVLKERAIFLAKIHETGDWKTEQDERGSPNGIYYLLCGNKKEFRNYYRQDKELYDNLVKSKD